LQLWIAKDGRSGLLTRTAMMEGVSSSAPMKFSVRLLNWSVGYFPAGVHVIVPQVEVTREIQPLPWKKTEVILEM
jgi:hypothetical protein